MINKATYLSMVQKLSKPNDEVVSALSVDKRGHLVHMTLGIVGESKEAYDAWSKAVYTSTASVNGRIVKEATKELGDMLFYITGAADALKLNLPDGIMHIGTARSLVSDAAVLAEFVKKYIMYENDKYLPDLITALEHVYAALCAMAAGLRVPMAEIRQVNYDKLSERYNGLKYSNEAAVERKDVTD